MAEDLFWLYLSLLVIILEHLVGVQFNIDNYVWCRGEELYTMKSQTANLMQILYSNTPPSFGC